MVALAIIIGVLCFLFLIYIICRDVARYAERQEKKGEIDE